MSARILIIYRVIKIFSGLPFLLLSCCGLVSECPNYYNISGSTKIDTFSLKVIDSSALKVRYVTNINASKYEIISDFKSSAIRSNLISDIFTHSGGEMLLYINGLNSFGSAYYNIDFGLDSITVSQSESNRGTAIYNGKTYTGSIISSIPLTSRITNGLDYIYTIETADTITGYLKFTVSGMITQEEETCHNSD